MLGALVLKQRKSCQSNLLSLDGIPPSRSQMWACFLRKLLAHRRQAGRLIPFHKMGLIQEMAGNLRKQRHRDVRKDIEEGRGANFGRVAKVNQFSTAGSDKC